MGRTRGTSSNGGEGSAERWQQCVMAGTASGLFFFVPGVTTPLFSCGRRCYLSYANPAWRMVLVSLLAV